MIKYHSAKSIKNGYASSQSTSKVEILVKEIKIFPVEPCPCENFGLDQSLSHKIQISL